MFQEYNQLRNPVLLGYPTYIQVREVRETRPRMSLYWSQSYQTLIYSFFRFSLLSLSVCSIGKYCLYIKMAKLNSKKKTEKVFALQRRKFGRIDSWTLIRRPNFSCNFKNYQRK